MATNCTTVIDACLNILDRIRREIRGGLACSEILQQIQSAGCDCPSCASTMGRLRQYFVPLSSRVYPGDAQEHYKELAGLKPAGSV
jgi:hypothetical protein